MGRLIPPLAGLPCPLTHASVRHYKQKAKVEVEVEDKGIKW
jgi:hypothetical protein